MRAALQALMVILMCALIGCKKDAQCSEDVPCGFGETCVDGTCQGKSCASSAQCDMETYCSGGECTAGCEGNDDCYPGTDCQEGACAEAACRSSTLDCGFKEFCNTVNGDCYEASGYYCMPCGDDSDCQGGNDESDNLCLGWGLYGNFCGVTCEVEDDCPSGFTCVGVTDGTGNLITHQCITYCWLYITDEDEARVVPTTDSDARPELPPYVVADRAPEMTCSQDLN